MDEPIDTLGGGAEHVTPLTANRMVNVRVRRVQNVNFIIDTCLIT